ncbi:MAG: hypothetical protein H6603_04185 [Flavobacteriales bacterium]|nr:hypothetical protein [Flavobacteriales bacterium]MCB9204158.1 hypothetical protein [Flavobacteriales bacterium]
MKWALKKLLYILVITAITLVITEFSLRFILFSDIPGFENLRDPSLYAKVYNDRGDLMFSDDYWKLYHRFRNEYSPPDTCHPELGWVGDFERKSLKHYHAHKVGKRRAVLLYGDSFAQCVNAQCFQEHLNSDSAFSEQHYLLNYGVGGYGVGQIYSLFRKTATSFEKPFVVFSIMTHDLDRTVLSNRIGPKPYYEEINGQLIKKGIPVETDPDAFYNDNPPSILSYLYRLFLSRFVPQKRVSAEETCQFKKKIARTNQLLLEQTIGELKSLDTDYLVLIFNPLSSGKHDWRHLWLRRFLNNEGVPHLFTIDIMEQDAYEGGDYALYEQPENGHPTTYQVSLISEVLKKAVMDSSYLNQLQRGNILKLKQYEFEFSHEGQVELQTDIIKQDSVWLEHLQAKALQTDRPLDEILREDAEYTVSEMHRHECEIPSP